ncbi:hypothetical protein B0H13DRAFT_1931050 [Mycena leptocephala]|nr:hypothetical protein B0H13DRAFT_1931050 [Mycena leptocephala]
MRLNGLVPKPKDMKLRWHSVPHLPGWMIVTSMEACTEPNNLEKYSGSMIPPHTTMGHSAHTQAILSTPAEGSPQISVLVESETQKKSTQAIKRDPTPDCTGVYLYRGINDLSEVRIIWFPILSCQESRFTGFTVWTSVLVLAFIFVRAFGSHRRQTKGEEEWENFYT